MQEEEVPANGNASDEGDQAVRIEEEPTHDDMEIEDEPQEEEAEAVPPAQDSDEAVEKSKIQKDAFMEMFRKAPRIKDILPDLREFMEHPDVIEWDRREVEHLVELRIQEEKAKRKAEKAKEKQQQQAVVPPVISTDSLQSAVGFDLAGILQKIKPLTQPVVVPIAQPVSDDQPLSSELISSVRILPPPTIKPTQVETGRAGFDTPHPNEAPADLRNVKPEMIAPIPDELRVLPDHNRVKPIPNELLPPDQQVPEETPIVFVRPPLRKTLFLAGARAGKRAERLKKDEKQGESNRKKKKRLFEEAREQAREQENRRAGGFPKRRGFIELTGMNALPAGLNKNSPVAVKRYHARQLAKETGISVEEAMKEIEAREHDERAMELIKKRGEERWNQRYNYTPADHSKGIPGVDRPPAGLPPKKAPEKSRYQDEEPIPGVNRPPVGYREPVPGIDRPPAGDRPREPIPGVDRPPMGDRGYRRFLDEFREPIPGVDRPPGERRRARGGVKEREKKRRREEFRERGRGGGRGGRGGGGGGRGGFDRYDDREGGYGRDPKAGRYDDYGSRDQYYQGGGYDGYDDRGGYDDYYGRQDGYDGYNQYGGYGAQEGESGYGYDQQGADAYYQQGYEGQEAAGSSYYQEDGSQYYNEYYGTSDQQGAGEGAQQEYHATFGEPSTSSSANQPPAA